MSPSATKGYSTLDQKRNASGFTLIELLAVIALMTVIFTWAIPNFHSLVENNQLTVDVMRIKTALMQARNTAISRRIPVAVCPTTDQLTCLDDWTKPLMIFENPGERGVKAGNLPVLKIISAGHSKSIRYSALFGKDHVRFSSVGWAQGYNGSFELCTEHGRAAKLVLSRLGRVSRQALHC